MQEGVSKQQQDTVDREVTNVYKSLRKAVDSGLKKGVQAEVILGLVIETSIDIVVAMSGYNQDNFDKIMDGTDFNTHIRDVGYMKLVNNEVLD